MNTLHTINKSPFERGSMASAFAHASPGDAVLMIEDGVLGARKGGAFAPMIEESPCGGLDLRARARSRRARHQVRRISPSA